MSVVRAAFEPFSVIAPSVRAELASEAQRTPLGDFVEVGVYRGGSAYLLAQIARQQKRRLFLFDTFSGMPFSDPMLDVCKVGDFGDTNLAAVRAAIPDALIFPGVFPGTMPDDIGPIAFAHVDCDQFQSVRDCCVTLGPLMVKGGVMVFDDYEHLPGARYAVDSQFGDRVKTSPLGKARVYF